MEGFRNTEDGTPEVIRGGPSTKAELVGLLQQIIEERNIADFDVSSIFDDDNIGDNIEEWVFQFRRDPPRLSITYRSEENAREEGITKWSSISKIDEIVLEARNQFRAHSVPKQEEINGVLLLFWDTASSIGKIKPVSQWENSREEYTVNILVQSIETISAMYYLSESGFWDNALTLKRNIAELLTAAIAIGHDEQSSSIGKMAGKIWQISSTAFEEQIPVLRNLHL